MGLMSDTPSEQAVTERQSPEVTKRILVVDDDSSVQKTLKHLFEAGGFAVDGQLDGQAGLDSFHADPPSATILDLNLPKLSGRHLCKEMKAALPWTPVIILTATCAVTEMVILFGMGADDYITKPFSPRELLVRLRVALRHSNPLTTPSQIAFDGIVVDLERIEVTRNGTSVGLTAHEFKTLEFFVQNPDRIIGRTELRNKVYGCEGGDDDSRSIDKHVVKLRQKLENDHGRPLHFRTVHGFGYRFTL
jgi:two-component system, OmpR family, alkaline phosphatase synthesis response regulator PhoP